MLAVITIAVFHQSVRYGFVNYDDNMYVYGNPHIRHGFNEHSIRWAFSADFLMETQNADYWQPVTFLSRILDFELYGKNAAGHHMTNVILHVLNVVLLYYLLLRMTRSSNAFWPCVFTAALFAVHPLRVEAVTWVTSRKDVLSTFFAFLAIWAHVLYVERETPQRKLAVTGFYALGLMSKPMVMTLPFLLLLLDYWPLGRTHLSWKKVILEKWRLFALALASALITWAVGQPGAFYLDPPGIQFLNMPIAYVRYLLKTFYPVDLACYYPFPFELITPWRVIGSVLLLAAITVFAFRRVRTNPYLAVGWLWFLGGLTPVIGLECGGLGDRFSYIPMIGFYILFSWGMADLAARWNLPRLALLAGGCAAVCGMMEVSSRQIRTWENNATLFGNAIAVTQNNWKMHDGMGLVRRHEGDFEGAIAHFREAIRLKPKYAKAHYNMAMVFEDQGKLDEAIEHYSQALWIQPDLAEPHNCLGLIMERRRQLDKAIAHYREALLFDPYFVEAYNNLGIALAKQKKYDEASEQFLIALVIDPSFKLAQHNLEVVKNKKQIDAESDSGLIQNLHPSPKEK